VYDLPQITPPLIDWQSSSPPIIKKATSMHCQNQCIQKSE